jgi:hypothetical protein
LSDCISVNSTDYGYDTGATATTANLYQILNCFEYGSGTAPKNTATGLLSQITTLSGDPFVNGAGNDFSLNNIPGAGAELRGASRKIVGYDNYKDVGAVQRFIDYGGGQSGWAC